MLIDHLDPQAQEKLKELYNYQEAAPEEVAARPEQKYAVSVVSVIAYLIGVPEEHFGRSYLLSTYEELEKQEDAKTVRALCTVRNGMMKNIGGIINRSKNAAFYMDNAPDILDPAPFAYLRERKIRVTESSRKVLTAIVNLNNDISNRLFSCRNLIPAWVEWDYIKSIFTMPKGGKESVVSSATSVFNDNRGSYPYQCYINWRLGDVRYFHENPEYDADAKPEGNVLQNDRKFLVLLYRMNNAEFTDFARVTTADADTKKGIEDYMSAVHKAILVVDAENSDPYKLVSFLSEWKERVVRAGVPDPIYKIALIDDVHTIDAWDVVEQYTRIPVTHAEVRRIMGGKSRVDLAAALTAQRACLTEGADGILLASSDSDFFTLLEYIPEAKYMILAEKEKLSGQAMTVYEAAGAFVCLIDDFTDHLADIRKGALYAGIENSLTDHLNANLDELLEEMISRLRLDYSAREKAQFRETLARGLRVQADADGEMRVRVVK